MSENAYVSPTAELVNDDDVDAVSIPFSKVLFSFQGRIRRATFWLGWLAIVGMSLVLGFVMGALGASGGDLAGAGMGAIIFAVVFYVLVIWMSLAIAIKRWHDRDKSGWWVLIGLIPVVGPIWQLVENGFLAGTPGANRFGPPQA